MTSHDDEAEMADQSVFIGIDAETNLVISHLAGRRDAASAFYLVRDLKERLVSRAQLTTNGFRPYLNAVEENFGADVGCAMPVKIYGSEKKRVTPRGTVPRK